MSQFLWLLCNSETVGVSLKYCIATAAALMLNTVLALMVNSEAV